MNISESKLKALVWGVTILIPVVVIILACLPGLEISAETKELIYVLPKVNAFINGTAFVLLVGALLAIKNKNINLHRKLTLSAVILSVLFLLSYIVFHVTTEHTTYCGDMKGLYLFILITHIVLSAVIVPLVLFTSARGLMMDVEKHRKIAKITMPLWLYVTATGVIVYLMISPCYP